MPAESLDFDVVPAGAVVLKESTVPVVCKYKSLVLLSGIAGLKCEGAAVES